MAGKVRQGEIFSGVVSAVICIIALTSPLIFFDEKYYSSLKYTGDIMLYGGPKYFMSAELHLAVEKMNGQVVVDIFWMCILDILILIMGIGYGLYGILILTGHRTRKTAYISNIARGAAYMYSLLGLMIVEMLFKNFSQLIWPIVVLVLVITEYMGMRMIQEY